MGSDNSNGSTNNGVGGGGVTIGPDLNSTKSHLDKKEYRQILLSNGLRVVLISDTIALHDQQDQYYDDDDDEGDDDDQMDVDEKEEKKNDNDDEDDDDEEDDDEDDDDGDDDTIRKAAAAIIVGAGSFHDPPHAQGLAHYLEHMLFMGSTKYPGENQYDAFLSKHSGSDNAYTELEHTVYHLDMICQEYFFEALDMLAQFFISPLLKGDSMERELKSIESEFQLSKNSDECRLQQLFCHECALHAKSERVDGHGNGGHDQGGEIVEDKHPFGNFSWGNINSLKEIPEQKGINMIKELRKFYNCHYYAQNMSLVVIGGFTLDELQKQVVASFSDIPALPRMMGSDNNSETLSMMDTNEDEDKKDEKHREDEDREFYSSMTIQRENAGTWEQSTYTPIQKYGMPFNSKSLCNINRIVPVKDKHNLSLTWQIPPQWNNWKSKPVDYISHLLGHEGKGSLLSLLKSKSFVNECYAGVGSGGYENASSHALFCVTFTLSDHGVKYWMEIVKFVYMYVGMVRFYCHSDGGKEGGGSGLPMWIYDELKAIQDLAYIFADEETPIDLVESIADSLVPYHAMPPERLLDGDSLLFEFDGDAIKNLLDNYITPQNARVDIISSTFGRAADFEQDGSGGSEQKEQENNDTLAIEFSPEKAGPPLVEPIFGTQYWSHRIPSDLINEWSTVAEPKLPPSDSMLSLPPVNPFVPTNFALKALPPNDSHHPLLFCSLKLCVTVGKKKAWFPCTVNKYDGTKNKVLLVYEDEDEKWHKVDITESDFSKTKINPSFEGTLDSEAIKYKVISVPKEGEGAVLKYGDESDWHVDDGIHYPHVPPALPESRLPQLVHNTKLLKLWHLQDRKFKRPVAELRLKVACQNANKSPLQKACAELLAMIIHDATTEICYLANVCELGNSIRSTDFGFTLRVNGFDDKLLNLTDEILKVMFRFNTPEVELPQGINPDRFDACLEVLLRKYNNEGMRASSLCTDIRIRCLRPNIWSANAKAGAMKEITIAKFMNVVSDLLKSLSIEALFMGNVDATDAEAAKELITKAASSSKGIPKNKHPKQEVLVVTPTVNANAHSIVVPTIDPQEPNTAVEIYVQCGKDNIKERVLLDLLVQIMYEPLFDQLRTKEQLGYQVSCGTRWTYGIMGFNFKVVTTCKSADQVNVRIEEFLREFRKEIVDMSKETYMEHVVGLAKNKLEKFNSLEEEAGSLWYEITEKRYDWEVHRNEAHALRSITKDEVVKAFDDWLCPTKASQRRLIVHAIGTTEGVSSENRPTIPIEDVRNAIDDKVKAFHKSTGNKTWGKIF